MSLKQTRTSMFVKCHAGMIGRFYLVTAHHFTAQRSNSVT
jgi:hypothetical protein